MAAQQPTRQKRPARRARVEPVEYRAARTGANLGHGAAEANQRSAARTGEVIKGHPSTSERRRFGATGAAGAGTDTAPAHAAGLFGETTPISETPLAGSRSRSRGRGRTGAGGQRRGANPAGDQRPVFVRGTAAVSKQFRSTSRVLVVEFLACLVVVALKPTEPTPDQQATGAAGAFESTVPQLIAVMVVFMLLAALGAAGPNQQRVANLFGGLMTMVLLFKNHGAVTASITPLVAAKNQPGVGNAPAASPSNG